MAGKFSPNQNLSINKYKLSSELTVHLQIFKHSMALFLFMCVWCDLCLKICGLQAYTITLLREQVAVVYQRVFL